MAHGLEQGVSQGLLLCAPCVEPQQQGRQLVYLIPTPGEHGRAFIFGELALHLHISQLDLGS